MGFKALCSVVAGWQGREGVIVKFDNGLWVKVKSKWWFRAGRSQQCRWKLKEQQLRSAERRVQQIALGETIEQRVAVVGWPAGTSIDTVKRVFASAIKVEMITERATGKLRLVVVAFSGKEDQRAVLGRDWMVDGRELVVAKAYGRRARTGSKPIVASY